MGFHGEALLAPCPTPKLEDHPSSAVRDCLFNLFAATLQVSRGLVSQIGRWVVTQRQPMMIINCTVFSIIICLSMVWWENYTVTDRWKPSRIMVKIRGEEQWLVRRMVNEFGDESWLGDISLRESSRVFMWSVSEWWGWPQTYWAVTESMVPKGTAWENKWSRQIFMQ